MGYVLNATVLDTKNDPIKRCLTLLEKVSAKGYSGVRVVHYRSDAADIRGAV